jgi:cell division transport system ATP-binding protein
VIELQHVTQLYPASAKPALDDVSTEIDKGEFVFLIGSSGSGKSTFLRLLLKEDTPTSGTVTVNGQTLNTLSKWKVPKLRRTMGCVFQDFRLLRDRTVAQNVAFALEVINKPTRTIKRVVPEVLEMVGLEGKANRLPSELSGGEQQRWRSPERSSTGRWCCWPTSPPGTWTRRPARASCCCWSGSTGPAPR